MRRNSQSAPEPSAHSHPRATHDPGGTKDRIQQVALELFVLHGYEKTSLREISDRLGITKAALYYHYASKQELLKSVTQPLIDEFEVLVAGEPEPETLLRSYVDLLNRHQAVFQLVANDHASLAAAELVERSAKLRRAVVRRLAGPDPRPADYIRAAAAFGAISQGFMLARRVEPEVDPRMPKGGSADPGPSAEPADGNKGGSADLSPSAEPTYVNTVPDVEAAAGLPGPADYPEGDELTRILVDMALAVLHSGS